MPKEMFPDAVCDDVSGVAQTSWPPHMAPPARISTAAVARRLGGPTREGLTTEELLNHDGKVWAVWYAREGTGRKDQKIIVGLFGSWADTTGACLGYSGRYPKWYNSVKLALSEEKTLLEQLQKKIDELRANPSNNKVVMSPLEPSDRRFKRLKHTAQPPPSQQSLAFGTPADSSDLSSSKNSGLEDSFEMIGDAWKQCEAPECTAREVKELFKACLHNKLELLRDNLAMGI